MSGVIRFFNIIVISMLLHGCGGGDSAEAPWDGNTPTPTPTPTRTPTPTPGGGTPIYLGSGSGLNFSAGTLDVDVTSLSAGGATSVTATLADADGNLYQDSASVSFTSSCVNSGLASITTPITTNNGVASTTYSALGCSGSDTITATATVNGITRTATESLTVQPAEIGQIQFVSATPQIIGLRGFGLNEVAQVVFRVKDMNDNPVSNQNVNFSLSTAVGGVYLSNASDVSDGDGLVRADVHSGNVAATFRVTAALALNPDLSTQSNGLNVGIGIADQNSMSLALSNKNPEAFDIDGQEVTVTIHAADHFNNPVSDGTAVSFTAEGGQIQPQCLTSNGACSVVWTSSNPRPQSDARVSILATILGEEDFHDGVSNGVLDAGDTFKDMPEAFRDDNEDGVFDMASEEFLDFNSNGAYDFEDGAFNGALCCDAAKVANAVAGEACFDRTPTSLVCSPSKNTHVRAEGIIVMAKSEVSLSADATGLDGTGESLGILKVSAYSDMPANDQYPPSGTVITVKTTNGVLESEGSITVPSANDNKVFTTEVRWRGDATSSQGTMTISAKSPSGDVSDFPLYIDLTD